jgi:branched-chain amino acid transport system ATP-binding protein
MQQHPAPSSSPITPPLLEVNNLQSFYGAIEALKGVSLHVAEGEIVTLIGANGAGKSTLLMSLCGVVAAKSGSIRFAGHELRGLKTYDIVRHGIAQSPEGRRIFARMSVRENLQMGANIAPAAHFSRNLDDVLETFPRLRERLGQRAGTLSGGEQQMLAIGRALMSEPRLLLLDEPSLGLAPLIVKQIFSVIAAINQRRAMTVLLVEQNAFHALRLAHRGYVLVNGQVTLSGTGQELLANPEVRAAYLEGGH